VPSVLLVSTSFDGLARNQARVLGMPTLPRVVLQHPIGGTPLESVLAKVDAAMEEIVARLTTPLAAEPVSQAAAQADWVQLESSDWTGIQDEFLQRGWSDGLPVVPPTRERVEAMVAASRLPPDFVAGLVAPRLGIATVELIAANAVMAGCRPQHMPLLVTAVQAMSEHDFYLKNMQATTHPITPLMIVSGPLRKALNVHSGSGLFGPGPWANAALGRAIRLILLNIGGGRPGDTDKATMGHPGKYSYCIAENEEALPAAWSSLQAERGHGPEVSTVTLFGGEAPHNINDHESTNAGGVITMVAGAMAQVGQNNVYYEGEMLLVLSPEHAATIAAEGWSKDDVKRALYEQARVALSAFSQENRERRLQRWLAKRYRDRPLDTLVSVVQRWEDIFVVVAGGAGKHSMYVPTTGSSKAQTRAVLKPDGSPWLPQDFA
jgi:hypothetical protein